jgi:hypothetical protein
LDNCGIQRLAKTGWLVASSPGYYKVWHDRLLNWAVAKGIVDAVRDGRLNESDALVELRLLHRAPWDSTKPFLGYVFMDVLWIASAPNNMMEPFATRIMQILEEWA